jgi:hypothetical protein
MAQSLKLELTLEFAMQVSGDDARVRELKAQSPKLRAQSSKAQSSELRAQSPHLEKKMLSDRLLHASHHSRAPRRLESIREASADQYPLIS